MSESEKTSTLVDPSTRVVRQAARTSAQGARHTQISDGYATNALSGSRSLIIQEAVDEFLKLSAKDSNLTPDDYCQQFSDFSCSLQSSICRQLEVERFFHDNTWLKRKLGAVEWPQPGDQRGSFRFIEQIGKGGASRVYLCTQPGLGDRQVVVKVSPTSPGEADSLGRLSHCNIVPVLSIEEDRQTGLSMLCMPFLGRSTLHDYIDQTQVGGFGASRQLLVASRRWQQPSDKAEPTSSPVDIPSLRAPHQVVAWIGLQIANALSHAHRHGIFHGDVKPSNILLTCSGAPLLMDFNLSANLAQARAADGGTLPYMPPEQLRSIALQNGAAGRYDQRSDIFSLGVVLYEALTGRLPFAIDNRPQDLNELAAELLRIQEQGATPIHAINGQTPAPLAGLVHKCLAFHPQARFQEAAQLAAALQAELSSWARFKWNCFAYRRHLIAAISLLGLLSAIGGVAAANRPPRHIRLLAEAARYQGKGDYVHAEQALEESLSLQPDFSEAQYELGRTLLAQESFDKASEVFSKLDKTEASARSAAYIAYCFNRQGEDTSAIPWYVIALDRGGRTPEVLNNLCYSYSKGGSLLTPREERQVSMVYLREAMEKAPDFRSAQLNYIRLAAEMFQKDDVPIPQDAPDICRELIQACPECGNAAAQAALVFAMMSIADPGYSEEGVGFLDRAIGLGESPNRQFLERSNRWAPFRSDPRWSSLLERADRREGQTHGTKAPLLVEPEFTARQSPFVK